MNKVESIYFKTTQEWRDWLSKNYDSCNGIYLILYKIDHEMPSMRWEEAVKVALCFGWIDSTVKSLGNGKRQQYFCPRKPKSGWSKVNKNYIIELTKSGLMHNSGHKAIEAAKQNGSWSFLDDVENGIVPDDLQKAFSQNPAAFTNYESFTKGQRKSYLYWLKLAKRTETREKRIVEIIDLCEKGIKSRDTR